MAKLTEMRLGDGVLQLTGRRADVMDMKYRVVGCLAVLVAVLGFGSNATAQQDGVYPPRPIVVSLSDTTLVVDAPFTVTVTGCSVGEEVRFSFGSTSRTERCTRSALHGLAPSTAGPRASTELRAPSRAGVFEGTVIVGTDGVVMPFVVHVEAGERIVVENMVLDVVTETPSSWLPRVAPIAAVLSLGAFGVGTAWSVNLRHARPRMFWR